MPARRPRIHPFFPFRHRVRVPAALLWLSLTVVATTDLAADDGGRAGHGHISVGYQFQTADSLQATIGEIDIGPVETHSAFVEIEYNLTDRLSVAASLPYVMRRYRGPLEHDPLLLDPPRPDIENVDQGGWNSGIQDIHLGVRYRWYESPTFSVEPHLSVGIPSHDYPFFGNAAIGQRQDRLEIGAAFRYSPGLSDAYYGLDISHAFVEQVLGVSIDHWRINAEVGYIFTPRLSGRLFALVKEGDGLDFPDDFPAPRNDERWFQHDRLVKHNFVNVGAGLSWAFARDYQLGATWMTMTHADVIHIMDYSVGVTVSRAF